MRIAQTSNNRPRSKGPAEQNHHKNDENKDTRDEVTGQGHELWEGDELQIHEDMEGALDGQMEVVQVQDLSGMQDLMSRLQSQAKRPVVRWEKFLPVRSLKVLLVEIDNSTRHVVSALLRNCGYEVIDVADGRQAWKILEDLTNRIDLVLTEISVPCLSGISLLSRVMRHRTRKNVPVIMMSSHGTMGIVLKCLSKGAVDFLVKPIRKNELTNLWQHVWRKCHICSGSGSESGIQTQKSYELKSEESDNNTGSNAEDIESIRLNVRDGGDNGSSTQSSWTKRAVEIDSPQKISTWDQVADPPDSSCAQVIYSRPEAFSCNWVPVNATRNCGHDTETDDGVMGEDLEIGLPRGASLQVEEMRKKIVTVGNTTNKDSKIDCKRNEDQLEMNQSEPESEKTQGESQNKAVDLLGSTAINTDPQMESLDFITPDGLPKAANGKEKAIYGDKEIPSLELSLKRMRDVQDIEQSAYDRNILRHSDLSAFSKYNSAPPTNQAPTGIVGSCSAGNSSEVAKTESMQNLQSNSNSPPPNQGSNGGSNGSSNNNDMGSTTNDAGKGHRPLSAFLTVGCGKIFMLQPVAQGGNKADTVNDKMNQGQSWDMNQHILFHNPHHQHRHHYHLLGDHDAMANITALQCGSSNMLVECHAANHSMNGSALESNNGQNGSSTPLNAQNMDHDGNKKMDTKCEATVGIEHVDRNTVDQNRNAQREAALNKFRQKRKERCFEKKVRYYSRKKLAEQRPRIRGQFVRQNANNNSNNKKGEDLSS